MVDSINLSPGATDRALLVGMTGSGKTRLAEEFCKRRKYVVAHDWKHELNWSGFKICNSLNELFSNGTKEYPHLIYRPNPDEIDDFEAGNQFFWWIFQRQRCTVYVDEVARVCNGYRMPKYYHACCAQGRSLGISTISSTQRPKEIPSALLSEAEHYYIFRLQLDHDRARIMNSLPINGFDPILLKKHQFIYATAEGDTIGLDRPLKLRL